MIRMKAGTLKAMLKELKNEDEVELQIDLRCEVCHIDTITIPVSSVQLQEGKITFTGVKTC